MRARPAGPLVSISRQCNARADRPIYIYIYICIYINIVHVQTSTGTACICMYICMYTGARSYTYACTYMKLYTCISESETK